MGRSVAEDLRTASLTRGIEMSREADLPTILSAADAEHYRNIFALQEAGHWAAADHEIAALGNKLLLGEVLAQRYRHRGYRTSYEELARWLDQYADEPDAKALYALALSRHPRGAPMPHKPVAAVPPSDAGGDDVDPRPVAGTKPSAAPRAAEHRRAVALIAEIRLLTPREPRRAEILLASASAKRLIGQAARDKLRDAIADAYLDAGDAQAALALSAAAKNDADAPIAHWHAGLAAWRLGRLAEAGRHFQAVARSSGQSPWVISAAAFWAARVELRNRRPELVSYWLGIAAEHPRTFYGLLARRLLGIDTYFDFDSDAFTDLDLQRVEGTEAGKRALALLEVGQRVRAESELRALAIHGSATLVQSVADLADRANLPALSLQLAAVLANRDGRDHDKALYPVPRWTPRGGFTVDRALLFALMRQESLFLPHVESYAGAVGLMQLMPATARSMAERTGLTLHGKGRKALSDPEINLTLAQAYVSLLLRDPHIDGNLLLLACAYNGGPSNTLHWFDARPEYRKDPLLFLESIPSHQTRVYAEHVLANYWIYRQRLGQPTPDLDALAAGDWPTYTAFDTPSEQDGRYASNR
jgi:soluble lytic murein transglycosylase-like protein